jgi:hypothetical protein
LERVEYTRRNKNRSVLQFERGRCSRGKLSNIRNLDWQTTALVAA